MTTHMHAIRHGPCKHQYIREDQKEATRAKEIIEMITEQTITGNLAQETRKSTRSGHVSRSQRPQAE